MQAAKFSEALVPIYQSTRGLFPRRIKYSSSLLWETEFRKIFLTFTGGPSFDVQHNIRNVRKGGNWFVLSVFKKNARSSWVMQLVATETLDAFLECSLVSIQTLEILLRSTHRAHFSFVIPSAIWRQNPESEKVPYVNGFWCLLDRALLW